MAGLAGLLRAQAGLPRAAPPVLLAMQQKQAVPVAAGAGSVSLEQLKLTADRMVEEQQAARLAAESPM